MSGKHHENPYRAGSQYNAIFGFIQKKQVVTREELLAFSAEKFGAEKTHDVGVILSPTKESKRGDCRGNASAQGHLYYMERLQRKTVKGVKEPRKLRLRWRETALEPRKRNAVAEVKAEKKAKAKKVEAKIETPVATNVEAGQAEAKD